MKGVNGCGCGSGVLKYLKPPYAKMFESACNAHDAAYDAGGTEADRKHADMWLYRSMIASVYKDYSPATTTWFMLIALLYYVSVRIFGKNYFNFKN